MKSTVRNSIWLIGALAIAALIVGGAALIALEPWNAPAQSSPIAVRASLQDYSWEELAEIADEIAGCTSAEEAAAKARTFNLCNADGSLSSARKTVELANGATVEVALAGIWHDMRTEGGKAGLTFVFADAAGEHAMNHAFEDPRGRNADSVGGWESSDMRSWLADTYRYELPADLRDSITSVQKRTANAVDLRDETDDAGHLAGTVTDWIGETSDKLWLFSATELCGNIPKRADLDVDSTMSAIYEGEGEQYQLFAEEGAKAFKPNGALVRKQVAATGKNANENGASASTNANSGTSANPESSASSGSSATSGPSTNSGPGASSESSGASNAAGEPTTWWLRTKTLEFGDGFWLVGVDGTPLNGLGEDARVANDPSYAPTKLWGPDHSRGVVIGFCL